jgi:hypothetical protein
MLTMRKCISEGWMIYVSLPPISRIAYFSTLRMEAASDSEMCIPVTVTHVSRLYTRTSVTDVGYDSRQLRLYTVASNELERLCDEAVVANFEVSSHRD